MAKKDHSGGQGMSMDEMKEIINKLEKQNEKLREKADLFDLVMEYAPIGITIHQDYIVKMTNPENIKLGGLGSMENAIGKSVLDFVSEESLDLAKERTSAAYDGKKPVSRVLERFKTAKGEVRDVVATTIPCQLGGKPASMVMFSDITSALEAQRALQRQQAHFKSLFDNVLIGQSSLNTKGEFQVVNSAFCEMTGYSRDELLSLGTRDLTHPDDLPQTLENVKKLLSGEAEWFQVEKRVKKKNGSYFWADLSVRAMRGDDGQVESLVGCIVDINKRVVAERQLERSEKLFRAIVEQSGDGIGLADYSGRYTFVNKAMTDMFGYTMDEFLDMTVYDMLSPAARDVEYPKPKDKSSWEYTLELMRKDGTEFWAEVKVFPITMSGGDFALGVVRDISQRRREEKERLALEAQIQKTQKLESLGILAGGIAHDFNNLLVGVLGNADLALHDLAPEAPARRSVRDIITAAERATELVRQMLAYAGKGKFLVEVLDLNAVVEEMTHLLDVSISKKAILRFDLNDEIPSIEADATQVRQVVMNLITNASDAIGDRSGVISIRTGAMECDKEYLAETYLDEDLAEGQYVYLEVSDTGHGMDDEIVHKVFDPFFSTKFAGRGLGLAAVLGIVRGHRGAVKVYSEEGKGTTFKVLFPAVKLKAEGKTPSGAQSKLGKLCGTVLLVDDEETVRSVGKRMIEHLGCKVVTCEDGAEAIELFRRDPDRFDAVLLDLTMPHMDGDACYRELRRIRPDVRVILSSGYNEAELVARFAGKGLAGFMQKPYRIDTLAEKIGEALGRKK